MISAHAKLSIRRIPLSQLRITETGEPWTCYPEKFNIYLKLLQDNPMLDLDPSVVIPAPDCPGIFDVKNGRHRYCASIMAGRADALCVVVEEEAAA